ncbi:hypothetical protein [Plantactinospora sp. WMMB782]|uniref:hypothetical protein n=1 Tax=Plantactinospora sp. WMMB782 TaxID=3404121 RepID=UPI003B949A39
MTGPAPGGRRTGREADGRPERAHLPQRPAWLCRACGVEWPCLAEAFAAAMGDLYLLNPEPGPDPARMYARFLGWVAPRMEIIRRREQASGFADPAGPADPSGSVGQPGEG